MGRRASTHSFKGFDVDKSKQRTINYTKAVEKVKKINNDPNVSKKIGTKSYWDKEIVPHIVENTCKSFKEFKSEIYNSIMS